MFLVCRQIRKHLISFFFSFIFKGVKLGLSFYFENKPLHCLYSGISCVYLDTRAGVRACSSEVAALLLLSAHHQTAAEEPPSKAPTRKCFKLNCADKLMWALHPVRWNTKNSEQGWVEMRTQNSEPIFINPEYRCEVFPLQ